MQLFSPCEQHILPQASDPKKIKHKQEGQEGHLEVLYTSDGKIKCLRCEYLTAERWCQYIRRFPLLDNFCSLLTTHLRWPSTPTVTAVSAI
jgi:hypothetical protein